MKKILIGLAALPLATFAVEASAQTYVNTNGAVGIQNRIMTIENRVNVGVQQGAISNTEANMLRNQLNQVRNLERQYSMNGLSQAERRTLQQRLRLVRNQLKTYYGRGYAWDDANWDNYNQSYGNNGYGNGYGNNYGNTTVRYDQYGRPVANNGVVYDQNGRVIQGVTYDQYGRAVANNGVVYDQNGRVIQGVTYDQYGRPVVTGNYSNGYYGQGGAYEPVPQQRSGGIGGVLGSVLGGALGGGGGVLGSVLGGRSLGVGDVITSAIGSVLRGGSSYGTQYRDNGSTYFRSDGQQVYEIDARTNQVVRIHPLR